MATENRRTPSTEERTKQRGAKSSRHTAVLGSKKRATTGASVPNGSTSKWIGPFSEPIMEAEKEIGEALLRKPVVTISVAVGVGVIGGVLFKKYRASRGAGRRLSPAKRAVGAGASIAIAGFLTKGLSSTVSRMESEFNAYHGGGLSEFRGGLTRIITDELTEKPFETIATAVGAGFGIANLEPSKLKTGVLRVAKAFAVRTFEGSGSAQLGNQGEENA